MQNYYQILGFDHPNITQEEIKASYLNWNRKYHPDKNYGDTYFNDRLKEINNANDYLSDAKKRINYDNRYKTSLVFNKDEIAKQKEQDALRHKEIHTKHAEKKAKQQQAQKQAEEELKAKMKEQEELKRKQQEFEAQKEKIKKQEAELAQKQRDLDKEKENLKKQQPNDAERSKREQELSHKQKELHIEKEYLTAELENLKHKESEYKDRINFLHTENKILEEKLKFIMGFYTPKEPDYPLHFIGAIIVIILIGGFMFLGREKEIKPDKTTEIVEVIPPAQETKKKKIQKYLTQIAAKETNRNQKDKAKANLLKIVNELAAVYILAQSDANIIKNEFLLEDYVDDIILTNKVKMIKVVEIEVGSNEKINEITIKETEN